MRLVSVLFWLTLTVIRQNLAGASRLAKTIERPFPPEISHVKTRLASARVADPSLVAGVLRALKVHADSEQDVNWLSELRSFNGEEWAEMTAAMKAEGVALADRSRLRRLVGSPAAPSHRSMQECGNKPDLGPSGGGGVSSGERSTAFRVQLHFERKFVETCRP